MGWPKVPKELGFIVFPLALALAGCAGLGLGEIEDPQAKLDATMYVTCESFTSSLRVVNTFRSELSAEQYGAAMTAAQVAVPACNAYREDGVATTQATLNAVRDALREMVVLEGMKP